MKNSMFHLQLLRTSEFIFICAEEVHVIKIQARQWTELFHAVGSCVIFSHSAKWKAWINVFQMLRVDCSFLFFETILQLLFLFDSLHYIEVIAVSSYLSSPNHPKFLFELVLRLFLNLVHLQGLFEFSSQ